jgi:hypothetical protein
MTKRRQTSGNGVPVDTAAAAADRFFRAYYKHSTAPDEDTLFDLLNALHSLNDKLGKFAGTDLHASAFFTVLRKLRNLFHHEAELLHEVRMIYARDMPTVTSDLAFVCLVPRSLIIQSLKDEKKPDISERVISTVRWYGTVADIQPCVFNAAVDAYEIIRPLHLGLSSEAHTAFDELYEKETRHGRRHHVTGEIGCLAGDVDQILERLFHQPPRGVRA